MNKCDDVMNDGVCRKAATIVSEENKVVETTMVGLYS